MERIQFGTLSILSCPVDKYMEKFFDSEEAPDQEIDVIKYHSLTETLKKLENGELDLLAMPAELLHGQHLQMYDCLLYTSPSPRDQRGSRMPSSA